MPPISPQIPETVDVGVIENKTPTVEVAPTPEPLTLQGIAQTAGKRREQLAADIAALDTQSQEQQIADLMTTLGQRGELTQSLRQEAGISDLRGQLADVQAQLTNIPLEQDFTQRELTEDFGRAGQRQTRGFAGRRRDIINQDLAQKERLLFARANFLQGRVNAAEQDIQDAVSVKFEPVEQQLQIELFNLGRLDEQIERGDRKLTAAEQREFETQKAVAQSRQQEIQRNKQGIQEVVSSLLTNGAPQALINQALQAETVEQALATPGISQVLGREQQLREQLLVQQIGKIRDSRAAEQAIASSSNLDLKTRQALSKDKTSQQALGQVSVISLLEDYRDLVESFGKTPTRQQKKTANSFLLNEIAPAMAVSKGQGALTDDERRGLVDSLGVKKGKEREKVTLRKIQTSIDANKSDVLNKFDFIDSSFPGATDNFEIFRQYKIDNGIDVIASPAGEDSNAFLDTASAGMEIEIDGVLYQVQPNGTFLEIE